MDLRTFETATGRGKKGEAGDGAGATPLGTPIIKIMSRLGARRFFSPDSGRLKVRYAGGRFFSLGEDRKSESAKITLFSCF